MIRRFYDGYVNRLASERGIWAFFKWFCLGLLLQVSFMIPALPLVVVGVASEADAGMYMAAVSFIVVFLTVRVFVFALPCMAVAERKGFGAPLAWAAGGLVFGPIALGVAAALSPQAAAPASA